MSLRSRLSDIKYRIVNRRAASDIDDIGMVYFDVGGETVGIPVDDDGFVPTWALAMRFQEVGDFDSDVGIEDDTVLPSKLTPEEVLGWWLDPSSCDIAGLDDGNSLVYDVRDLPPEQQMVQRKIGIVASPEEQRRIRQILSESFTIQELEIMSRYGSIVIHTKPNCDEATGCYWRKQDGIEIPLITLEEGCTDDGVVHELVHHLRAMDASRNGATRTTYPTDRTGRMDNRRYEKLPQSAKDRILEEEEKHTVAETVVRTGKDPMQSGYYDSVAGMNPREAYLEDRRIITDTPPNIPDSEIPRLTGKAARDAVTRGYEYSNIARAQILSRDVNKR